MEVNGRAVPLTTQKPPSSSEGDSIQGEVLDLAVNLKTVRPGDRLDIPYEMTITESMHDFWNSLFHGQDRIHTSRLYARKMGLQDKILPFPLALFLTSSMTHADAAKVQVGFGRVNYLWPAFANDTFTKTFRVESVRNTSDGNHSIIQFTCDLINQRGRVCMRADKRLLFEFPLPQSSSSSVHNNSVEDEHLFRDHLLSKADVLRELGSHSLAHLRPGQLILHSLQRCLSQSMSQQLSSLARLTHERHFDTRKYEISEILIPGGLVLGCVMSAASRDLHEVLHEELLSVQYVNSLHPGNLVGAISYIQSVDENVPGDLECLNVRTIGIKNMDVKRDLYEVNLPIELFQGKPLKPKEIESICKTKCPKLSNKIIVQMDRRIIRQVRPRSCSHDAQQKVR
jgi:acyl dehydratase